MSDEYVKSCLSLFRSEPQIYDIMQESPHADSGCLVSEKFENQIVIALEENNIIRIIAKTLATAAERKILIAATHKHGLVTILKRCIYRIKSHLWAKKTLIQISDALTV